MVLESTTDRFRVSVDSHHSQPICFNSSMSKASYPLGLRTDLKLYQDLMGNYLSSSMQALLVPYSYQDQDLTLSAFPHSNSFHPTPQAQPIHPVLPVHQMDLDPHVVVILVTY